MPYSKVIISIAYGKVDDAHVLNAVYIAVSKLKKLRIEPVIVQYYTPGLKLRVAVNGIELKVDEEFIEELYKRLGKPKCCPHGEEIPLLGES